MGCCLLFISLTIGWSRDNAYQNQFIFYFLVTGGGFFVCFLTCICPFRGKVVYLQVVFFLFFLSFFCCCCKVSFEISKKEFDYQSYD